MSEIKGQLLGMLMVLVMFGLFGTVLYASFSGSVDTLSQKLAEETSLLA